MYELVSDLSLLSENLFIMQPAFFPDVSESDVPQFRGRVMFRVSFLHRSKALSRLEKNKTLSKRLLMDEELLTLRLDREGNSRHL